MCGATVLKPEKLKNPSRNLTNRKANDVESHANDMKYYIWRRKIFAIRIPLLWFSTLVRFILCGGAMVWNWTVELCEHGEINLRKRNFVVCACRIAQSDDDHCKCDDDSDDDWQTNRLLECCRNYHINSYHQLRGLQTHKHTYSRCDRLSVRAQTFAARIPYRS